MSIDRLAPGYEPRFDLDAEVGRQGELIVANTADALARGAAEVKTDERARDTGHLYVELECRRSDGWQPSGINTTEAEVWAYVLDRDRQIVVSMPTAVLREMAEKAWTIGMKAPCRRGSHPTRGALVPVKWILPVERRRA